MTEVLITGGSGFLGGKLAKAIRNKGHKVRLLVRSAEQQNKLADLADSFAIGTLENQGSLQKACEGIDTIFHCAGMISYNPEKRSQMHQVNVVGTRNIAQAAHDLGVKRFIFTSSTAAIGVNEDPEELLDETTVFNAKPLGLAYFDTKYEAEQELLKFVDKGLAATIVNPGSLLGPGDTRRYEKGYAGLIYKYNPRILFHGGINFVDIDDVVNGHLLAWEKGRVGERYLLGGENIGFGDLIIRMNILLGRKPPKQYVPLWAMGGLALGLKGLNAVGIDIHMSPFLVKQVCRWYLYVSSAKAKKELGYRPKIVDTALLKSIQWLKEIGKL
ncbi:MAG: NAD-dependent epimerase/dehydratase family protein [Oligoflexia bacterium]|nr:NAD-dependent epimerase/dehydratase family protein [Oligoflexia bacterium]